MSWPCCFCNEYVQGMSSYDAPVICGKCSKDKKQSLACEKVWEALSELRQMIAAKVQPPATTENKDGTT